MATDDSLETLPRSVPPPAPPYRSTSTPEPFQAICMHARGKSPFAQTGKVSRPRGHACVRGRRVAAGTCPPCLCCGCVGGVLTWCLG